MSDTLAESGGTQIWDFESQIDEVCDLFEAAWKRGGRPRIEDYLNESPVPARAALLRELIPLDMEYRKRNGETFSEDDYRARFPSWSSEELTLGPGNTIPLKAGRYLLEDKIGAGGMGEVFRVLDPDLHRCLAVKILLEKHRGRTDLEARFLEEAQILGQLQHPGIVPVHEIGRIDDGRPFFAMKLVRGQTLAKLLKDRPRPDYDLPRFLAIFEQICQTMANAHAQGVIHRDLKPSNVMVGAFGEVQVMDWGLAKVLNRGRKPSDPTASTQGEIIVTSARTATLDQATYEGRLIGTLPFMAPEQALGEIDKHDERTDVFLLGGILSVILTGYAPYEGTSGLGAQQAGELQPAQDLLAASGADSELIELAKACLTPDRGGRPRHAGVVAERIARYMVAVQERLRAVELARAKAVTKAEEQRKRHRIMRALAGSVLLLVVSGAAGGWWWAWKRGQNRQQIDLVMNEAHVLQQQRKLRQAADTAKRAVALAEAGPVSADLREWVLQEAAALDAEAGELERRRQFLDLLSEERTSKDDEFEELDTDIGYVGVFRSIDIDVDQLSVEEATQRFRGWREEELIELAGALDDWARERRRLMRPEAEWQRLLALARAVDGDEWRSALRSLDYLNIAKERDRLLNLADTAKVSELPPASVELLGRALRAAGAVEQAVVVLQEAQRLHPRDVWLNYELAETFKAQEKWGDAVRFYTAARSVRPVMGHSLGHALEHCGKRDEAVKVFAELTRLQPANARHHTCLGHGLRDKQQLDEAMREFRTAVDLDPRLAVAHGNLGIGLRDKGQLDEAIREFRTAVEIAPKSAVCRYNFGNALAEKKQLNEAIREYRIAIDLNPKLALAHNNLGVTLAETKQLDEAIREFRTAIDLDPKDAQAHNGVGSAMREKKQLEDAIREYRTAIGLDPKLAKAHNNLGVALAEEKQLDEAIREFRTAIDLLPKDASAHYNLGNALYAKRQLDEAIREFRTAVDLDPNADVAHGNLGSALRDKGQLDEAIREYRTAIDLNPKSARAHYNLGCVLSDKNHLDEAIREYRAAIEIEPMYANAHGNLGLALYHNKQLDEAIREYRRAIDLDANDPTPHNNLGTALRDKNDLEGAIVHLRKAIDLDAKYSKPHTNLGLVFADKQQWDKAIQEYCTAIDLDAKDAAPHNNLGAALFATQRLEAAIREFRAGIKLDANDAEVHRNLGVALYAQGHLDEAMGEFRKAIELDPRYPQAHNDLGVALKDKKQLDEAIRELSKAIDLDPKFARPHGALGETLLQLGRFTEARNSTRRCLDLMERDDPLRQLVTQQLQRCERLMRLDQKLAAILDEEKEKPGDNAERLGLARLCQQPFKKLYATSFRFYAEAFAHDAKLADDMQQQHRYNAARAAALAGCGQGKDADKLDDKDRPRLRKQSLDWLRIDLIFWTKQAETDKAADRAMLVQTLKHWQEDPDLAGVRDKSALEKLTDAERAEWEKLWADVAELLKSTK
jgi:serine/threonine-protein kinase